MPRPRKERSGRVDSRRTGVEYAIRVRIHIVYRDGDGRRVQIHNNRFVVVGGDDVVALEGRNRCVVLRGESVTKRTRAGWSGDDRMRRVSLDQRLGEKLPTEKVDVVVHRQNARLVMKMF